MNYEIYLSAAATNQLVNGSKGIRYSYDGCRLMLAINDRPALVVDNVKPGLYQLNNSRGRQSVTRKALPRDNRHLLAWLLSFKRAARTETLASYEHRLADVRREYRWMYVVEETLRVDGCIFTMLYSPRPADSIPAAAYLPPDQEITKSTVIQVLKGLIVGIKYPREFVYKVLRDRFGFTDTDISELEAWETESHDDIFKKGLRRRPSLPQRPQEDYERASSASILGADL